MFEYVSDARHWEDWQREYRFGAFCIFPPDEVISAFDELRRRYDAMSRECCQAHVSLTEPLSKQLSQSELDEIREALTAVLSFDVHYGPLRTFPPFPGNAYAISPEDRFSALRRQLHSTSAFAHVSSEDEGIAPHLTIAEFITLERTDELLRELSGRVPQGSFCCRVIEYAVPDEHFHFQRKLVLPLSPPADS